MASQGGISGVAVGMATAGAFLLYIGIQGVDIRTGLKAIAGGSLPAANPRSSGAIAAAEETIANGSGSSSGPSAADAPAGSGGRLVAAARAYLGTKYVWGGTSKSGIDCSGLVVRAFQAAYGVTPPRTTQVQIGWNKLAPVPKGLMAAGDLCFWPQIGPPSHVAIATGPGTVIHAPRPGKVVQEVMTNQAFTGGMAPRVYRYKGAT